MMISNIFALILDTYNSESHWRHDAAERKQRAYEMLAAGCDADTIQLFLCCSDPTFERSAREFLATGKTSFADLFEFMDGQMKDKSITEDDAQ